MSQILEEKFVATIAAAPHAVLDAKQIIEVEYLLDKRAQAVYQYAIDSIGAGEDPKRVGMNLSVDKRFMAYTLQCRKQHGTSTDYQELFAAIAREAHERHLRGVCSTILGKPDLSPSDIAIELSTALETVSKNSKMQTEDYAAVFARVFNKIREGEVEPGTPSGLHELDKFWMKRPRELTVFGARPSIGKTLSMLHLADEYAAMGERGILFSLEMAKDDLVYRNTCRRTEIEMDHLGKLKEDDRRWPQLVHSFTHEGSKNILISDSPASADDIRLETIRIHREKPIQFIMIDYFQIVKTGGIGRNGTRDQALGQVAYKFKQLAKELNISVILLAQINRNGEGTETPQLSDLRECGELENIADVIILMHRDRKDQYEYNRKRLNGEHTNPLDFLLRIAKNRNGGTGDAFIAVRPEFQKLMNMEKKW